MNAWFDSLGPIAWPLASFSALALGLVIERLAFFIGLDRLTDVERRNILALASSGHWPELRDYLDTLSGMVANGLRLLLSHKEYPHDRVEYVAALWLTEQRRKLQAHLRWLGLLAVASPLLGLLGTVLGMITAFQDLAAHTGPVSPSVLANGLQQAMLTTAFGLIIAIPALIAGHAFRIWADAYLASMEYLLNRVHLAIDGVALEEHFGVRDSEKTIHSCLREETA